MWKRLNGYGWGDGGQWMDAGICKRDVIKGAHAPLFWGIGKQFRLVRKKWLRCVTRISEEMMFGEEAFKK